MYQLVADGIEDPDSILALALERTALEETAFIMTCVEHGYERWIIEGWITESNHPQLRKLIEQGLADPQWTPNRHTE